MGSTSCSSTETCTSLNTSVEDPDDEPASNESKDVENAELNGHKGRRELLGARLDGYKQEKLKQNIPVDAQMLTCAKEDLQLKKRMIEQMDKINSQHDDSMKKLISSNMEKLTHYIADGFSLLQGLLYTHHLHPTHIIHMQVVTPLTLLLNQVEWLSITQVVTQTYLMIILSQNRYKAKMMTQIKMIQNMIFNKVACNHVFKRLMM